MTTYNRKETSQIIHMNTLKIRDLKQSTTIHCKSYRLNLKCSILNDAISSQIFLVPLNP